MRQELRVSNWISRWRNLSFCNWQSRFSRSFVHMEDETAAAIAVDELNGVSVRGRNLRVERSQCQEGRRPRKRHRQPTQKIFVGNLSEGVTSDDLRRLFEPYCEVVEADVIKNFGFVHVEGESGKAKVSHMIRELNGRNVNGTQIRVQPSTSGVRHKPGMGGGDQCYRCGADGHWSKECQIEASRPHSDYYSNPPPLPPPPPRIEDSLFSRRPPMTAANYRQPLICRNFLGQLTTRSVNHEPYDFLGHFSGSNQPQYGYDLHNVQ